MSLTATYKLNEGRSAIFLALLSGLLFAVAFMHINFVLGLFCLIPLLFSCENATPREAFLRGGLSGLILSSVGLFWMIDQSARYTGITWVYGFIAMLISMPLFSIFFSVAMWIFVKYKSINKNLGGALFNAAFLSSVWLTLESARAVIFIHFPFLASHSGYIATANLYALQYVAYTGFGILTFILVAFNYLVFHYLNQLNYRRLLIPVGLLIAYLFGGYFLFHSFEGKQDKKNEITIALSDYNFSPEVQWNAKNGDSLASVYRHLNWQAIQSRPQLIIWPESSIPWSYSPTDALSTLLLKESNAAGIHQLIGLNIPINGNPNLVHNTAALFAPDGTLQTYYKSILIQPLEESFSWVPDFLVPFGAADKLKIQSGSGQHILSSAIGNIGVFICNETLDPSYKLAQQGAEYYVAISNDSWFSNCFLARIHFYVSRIRAVEARKDMCIDSNCGYTGLISASGEIKIQNKDLVPVVYRASVFPNSYKTLATRFPYWFQGISIFLMIAGCLRSLSKK